jgi:hypothetical protein
MSYYDTTNSATPFRIYELQKRGLPITEANLHNFADLVKNIPEIYTVETEPRPNEQPHGTSTGWDNKPRYYYLKNSPAQRNWGSISTVPADVHHASHLCNAGPIAPPLQPNTKTGGVSQIPASNFSKEPWYRDRGRDQHFTPAYHRSNSKARRTHEELANKGRIPHPKLWVSDNYEICKDADLDSRVINPSNEYFGTEYRLLYAHLSGADPVAEVLQTAYLQGALYATRIHLNHPTTEEMELFNIRGAAAAFRKQQHLIELGINLKDINTFNDPRHSIWEYPDSS